MFDPSITPPSQLPDLVPIIITSFPYAFGCQTLALSRCRQSAAAVCEMVFLIGEQI
jgi:hypothetical protein